MTYTNTGLKPPLFDTIDRFTIIELKRERLKDEKDRAAVENEYDYYKCVLDAYRDEAVPIKAEWLESIKEINARIWDVEADIRNARRNNLTNEEVGVLAVRLRDLNDERTKRRDNIMIQIPMDFYETGQTIGNASLKLPLHETIDRATISRLKVERLSNPNNAELLRKELLFYEKVLDQHRKDGLVIKQEWIDGMYDINRRVWDRESAIRQGRENEYGLEEMGRRTLELREMSKERVAWKNKVATEAGSRFYEVKTETV